MGLWVISEGACEYNILSFNEGHKREIANRKAGYCGIIDECQVVDVGVVINRGLDHQRRGQRRVPSVAEGRGVVRGALRTGHTVGIEVHDWAGGRGGGGVTCKIIASCADA